MICNSVPLARAINAAIDDHQTQRSIRLAHSIGKTIMSRHKYHYDAAKAKLKHLEPPPTPAVGPVLTPMKHTPSLGRVELQDLRPPERQFKRYTKDEILTKASVIIDWAEDLFIEARNSGNIKDAVHALDGVRRSVELVGKYEGLGAPGPSTVIDHREVTILNTVSQLSIEEMRAIAYGKPLDADSTALETVNE
jgi:hypothetical protein